ncbi:MAG: serine O-acetyltransferase [Methanobrevibacter sp.]|uniref:Serine acetyltransferase n=1 Tax=Methanobrevibacter millerae TaxID=230361 RepID=A0A8T3VFK7_9EURY|nr:serine O-acetyltransferase [Methanobrevibacter sp.]MBE6510043.1 serine O-acetyltransferase [Methanobrevibacter millerae]MBO5151258.1 serine O-acetyltransferase [Methanobrevibacter sp.]MBO6275358.1 serine O-acetyltransferase [Methanobrevibacter sp.]
MFDRLRSEIKAIKQNDPAARSTIEIFLCYPGFYALLFHRLSHYLWNHSFKLLARFISTISRFLTGIEIHPGAQFGERVFIDHGMGIVVGETTIVGDDVLIYQGVVLGGTTTQKTKRHPTIEKGVIIGAGAKVMGNITIGEYSKIGTGAVVLKDVPPESTCVGVPGRIVKSKNKSHIVDLEHNKLPDPVADAIRSLEKQIKDNEELIRILLDKNGICLTDGQIDEKIDCGDLLKKDGD